MGKNKKKSSKSESSFYREADSSSRFDTSKPQFRKPKEKSSKVVLDERFASVLTDPRFQLDIRDKYGRKKKKEEGTKEELSAFYLIEEKEEDSSAKKKKKERNVDRDDASRSGSSSEEEEGPDDDKEPAEEESEEDEQDPDKDPASRIAYLTALSRGQLDVFSSSDEDDTDSDDDSQSSNDDADDMEGEDAFLFGTAGVLDPSSKDEEVEMTNEASPYLAVMNMDWLHVRAVDIFGIVSSFTPPGAVKRVQVFPSDFGLQQLAKEEMYGPSDLWKQKSASTNEEEEEEEEEEESSAGEASAEDTDEDDEEEELLDETALLPKADHVDSDFVPEKLRAYEASKLKYYFAVVEFASPEYADVAYKEVDGLEFEHSSAAMDLRAIPPSDLGSVVSDRKLRDEATGLPSNYVPPDFVVSALQQSSVQCTWEMGDRDRERHLTKYTSGDAWGALAESDDLRAYLASDVSSCDEEEDGSVNERAANMRKMLGLDTDEEEDTKMGVAGNESESAPESSSEIETENEKSNDYEDNMSKEIRFVPGEKKEGLKERIRSKLESKNEPQELTPWQKYQEKRKQKRRERRQAARAKRQEVNRIRKGGADRPQVDDFFVDAVGDSSDNDVAQEQSREELELMVAGDEEEEEAKDYDMRELQRLEKNKDKKLRGSRKRKEAERAAAVSGTDFKIDMEDVRFKAVLDGEDDRFGIDRTDPNYKETPGMGEILTEQIRRRKTKKQKKSRTETDVPNVNADSDTPSSGAAALSALVQSIKTKVNQ